MAGRGGARDYYLYWPTTKAVVALWLASSSPDGAVGDPTPPAPNRGPQSDRQSGDSTEATGKEAL